MRLSLKPGRVLVLGLALFLAVGAYPQGAWDSLAAGRACAKAQILEAGGAPRPVLIVHEPRFGDSPDLQGLFDLSATVDPTVPGTTSSFGRYLESAGYTRGENLFEISLTGLRDLESGALRLSIAAGEALSRAGLAGMGGSPECDIVAVGLSGMIARYALENGYLTDFNVVNLVMASAPNRGTFLAGVVKSLLEVVRQESVLERETRAERLLPSFKGVLGVGEKSTPVSVKELTQAKSLKPPEWEDEASWISTRATTLWEPLYGEYVKNRFLALPYVPSQSPKETFAGWVRRTLPDVWKRVISEAEWPASKAQSLSLPYYEYLSMEVGRNQYAMRAASRGSLVSTLLEDPVIPKDWKEAAVHYGAKILKHFAQKALITVKAEVQELIAHEAVKLTGLGSGPESPFIAGLVKEDLLINLGTSSTKRFERIPANLELAEINRSSQSGARRRDTRYVSVISKLSNPWALIWPELGPNDSLLEVDCGVPPVGTSDLIAVFGGILRLPGKHVLDDPKAQEYVVRVLRQDAGGQGQGLEPPGASGGRQDPGSASLIAVDASSWRPALCPLEGIAAVTLGITELPSGWQLQVWEESSGSEGSKPGLMWGFHEGGTHVVRLSPGTASLGFRLVRNGPLNPVMGNTVASAFAQEKLARVYVAPLEKAAPEPVDGHSAQDPGEPSIPEGPEQSEDPARSGDLTEPGTHEPPGEPGHEGGSSGGGPGPTGPAGPPDGPGEVDLPPDLPTVRVVYRSKHTTLKKPKETVHHQWVLDYGDGSRETIQDQVSLTVDHTFESPGHYRVTAESYTSQGELLYRKTWETSVVLSGETHRYVCQSVGPIGVNIVLNGPKKWVTGKVAVYYAGADIDLPADAELVAVKFDPGEVFGVIWERAGDFVVGCACTVTVRYSLEDAGVEIENTYLMEVPVTVLTTGVTGW